MKKYITIFLFSLLAIGSKKEQVENLVQIGKKYARDIFSKFFQTLHGLVPTPVSAVMQFLNRHSHSIIK